MGKKIKGRGGGKIIKGYGIIYTPEKKSNIIFIVDMVAYLIPPSEKQRIGGEALGIGSVGVGKRRSVNGSVETEEGVGGPEEKERGRSGRGGEA